ncbi:MAG TPA: MFS transporter [Pseudomonadota bacterium]|nr:MFS transporter [Pseudomonadota bacterium]
MPPAAGPSFLYRFSVLFLVSLTLFGNYYVYDSLGLVADLLKKEYGISDAQYGFLSGIYSIAAVIVLLLGGAIIDRIGSKRSVLYFGGIAAAAGLLIALAPNYPLLLAGRFLLGIGAEPLSVAVTTALARWFKGRELALALGLNLTISRLGTVVVDRSPQWAGWAYSSGTLGRPLLLAGLIGLFCTAGAVGYYALEQLAERRWDLGRSGSTDRLSLDEVLGFGAPYWLVTGLCVTFYSSIFAFQSFATKFFIEAHGVPREDAGALLSYLPMVPMVATPLFGLLVDRFGRRSLGLLVGALLVAPAYFLMARRGLPLFYPVALLGLAFSVIPAILWPMVAYLIEDKRLGTAYSLMTLLQQIFLFAVSSAIGGANDLFAASLAHPAGYAPGMWLLGGLSLLGLLFALLLYLREKPAT